MYKDVFLCMFKLKIIKVYWTIRHNRLILATMFTRVLSISFYLSFDPGLKLKLCKADYNGIYLHK